MAEHEAFGGVTCDHLYHNCPALQRAIRPRRATWIGKKLVVGVDPEGSDVCGWCHRKWASVNPPTGDDGLH